MENHVEIGPHLPTRVDVVEMFKDENRTEDERMITLTKFIDKRQAECESTPDPLTRAYFNISLGRLYIDIGYINEAKVSYGCADLIIKSLLPKKDGEIPEDVLEAYYELLNLRDELRSLEPEEN